MDINAQNMLALIESNDQLRAAVNDLASRLDCTEKSLGTLRNELVRLRDDYVRVQILRMGTGPTSGNHG